MNISGLSLIPILFGSLMAVIDVVMMSTIKQVGTGAITTRIGLPFATLIYALEPYIFLQAMKYTGEGLAVTNLIWNLSSDIIVTLIGVMWFGEAIKGMRWVAVGMSIVALMLFAYTES